MAENIELQDKFRGVAGQVNEIADKLVATDGTGFYPEGITPIELTRIFQAYPEARNGTTKISRNPLNRRLTLQDYREAYAEDFSILASHLRSTAEEAADVRLNRQLTRTADVLEDPSRSWEEIFVAAKQGISSPDWMFWGLEEYQDELMKTQSVPVVALHHKDEELTRQRARYLARAGRVYRQQYSGNIPDVDIRVGRSSVASNLFEQMTWSANTQPNVLDWIKRHGAFIMVDEDARERNFQTQIRPTARAFFHPELISKYSDDQLREGHARLLVLHEDAHPKSFAAFGDLKELRDVRMIYHELYPTVLALSEAQDFDREYLEPMLISAFSWWIADYRRVGQPERDDYARGEDALAQFCVNRGVMGIRDNNYIYWDSMSRVMRAVDDFGALIREPMEREDYRRAGEIIDLYSDFLTLRDLMRRRDLQGEPNPGEKTGGRNHIMHTPAAP